MLATDANTLLPNIVRSVRYAKPAQDLKTYLDLETDARLSPFFRWHGGPWGATSEEDSPGAAIPQLITFGRRVPAAAALVAAELEVSGLELPVHQAPMPKQYEWVRPAIGVSLRALLADERSEASKISQFAERAYNEKKVALGSRERMVLRGVDCAFSAAVAALSGEDQMIEEGRFSTKALAGKSVHVIWRGRNQDEFLLQHIKHRLLHFQGLQD